MRYFVTVGGHKHLVEVGSGGVLIDGRPVDAELAGPVDGASVSALIDGRSVTLLARRTDAGEWTLLVDGRSVTAAVVDERTQHVREMTGTATRAGGPRAVRAPMPGMIVRVEVEPGQDVHTGDGLVIVEAMKMENELRAEADGRVSAVHVAAGEAVEKDQILVEFEEEEPTESADG